MVGNVGSTAFRSQTIKGIIHYPEKIWLRCSFPAKKLWHIYLQSIGPFSSWDIRAILGSSNISNRKLLKAFKKT